MSEDNITAATIDALVADLYGLLDGGKRMRIGGERALLTLQRIGGDVALGLCGRTYLADGDWFRVGMRTLAAGSSRWALRGIDGGGCPVTIESRGGRVWFSDGIAAASVSESRIVFVADFIGAGLEMTA